MCELLTADEMLELSEQGKVDFKDRVLNGPTFKKVISGIEDAALEGYTGWNRTIGSNDDVREFIVIHDYLKEKGYCCEFETETKRGLLGEYKVKKFVVKWDKK